MKKRRYQKGFTLLEVVVSITILALLVLMISRIFITSSDAVRRGSSDALLDEAARFVLDNLQTDISQALVRTNVPFRVDDVSVGDALYCISTAIRRPTERNPRDTAPIQVRSKKSIYLVSDLNRRVVFEYEAIISIDSDKARQKLIIQSNYYHEDKSKITDKGKKEYTEALPNSERLTNQAVLTFLKFRINGKSTSNRSGLPQLNDLPRFVDVIIGLAAANDMRQAMRLYESQSETEAVDYLSNHERVYTRRIHFPNVGINRLTF